MGGIKRRKGGASRRRTRSDREAASAVPPISAAQAPPAAPTPSREPLRRRISRAYGLDGAREYGPTVWTLAAGTVASYMGRGAAIPFVAIHLTENVGLSLTFLGVGLVIEQLTRALLSPVFGGLSDRYGRKPLMIGGLLFQAVTIPGYLFVDGAASYLLVSLLAGLGQAPYQPALNAFLSETTPRDRRAGVFGLVHMTKNLGMVLGLVLGGFLIVHSFAVVFVTGGVLPFVYALIVLLFVREGARLKAAESVHPLVAAVGAFRSPRFVAFLGAAVIVFISWGQVNWVFPVFIESGLGLEPSWVSRLLLVNSLIVVAFQVPVSERTSRWSRTRGLAFACLVSATAYAIFAAVALIVFTDPLLARAGLLLAVVVYTVAEMVETPLLYTLASELAPPNMTGGAMGALALAAPIGIPTSVFLAGAVSAAFSWTWVWVAFSGLLVAGAVAFGLLGAFTSRSTPKTPAVKTRVVH